MRYRVTSEQHRDERVHLGRFLVQFNAAGTAETESRELVLQALRVPGFKVAEIAAPPPATTTTTTKMRRAKPRTP